jgi:cytochrome c553
LTRGAHVRRWLVSCAPLYFALCGLMTAAASSPPAAIDRVMAAVPDTEHGKILYLKHCSACHGPHGWGDGPRAIPALAGQLEGYLIEQLTDFATEKRAGDSMHEVMRHADLNWAQAVRDLSAYLSRAPRSRASEFGEDADRNSGKALYLQACSMCHGIDGAGQEGGTPAIGGQQYRYLLARIRSFSSTHREQVQSPLVGRDASEKQLQNIANFVSRLGALVAGNDASSNGR